MLEFIVVLENLFIGIWGMGIVVEGLVSFVCECSIVFVLVDIFNILFILIRVFDLGFVVIVFWYNCCLFFFKVSDLFSGGIFGGVDWWLEVRFVWNFLYGFSVLFCFFNFVSIV